MSNQLLLHQPLLLRQLQNRQWQHPLPFQHLLLLRSIQHMVFQKHPLLLLNQLKHQPLNNPSQPPLHNLQRMHQSLHRSPKLRLNRHLRLFLSNRLLYFKQPQRPLLHQLPQRP